MDFKKMFGFDTADIGNDKEYRLYIKIIILIVISSIVGVVYHFIINDVDWRLFLFPIVIGIITMCFIVYKRKKGGYKLW